MKRMKLAVMVATLACAVALAMGLAGCSGEDGGSTGSGVQYDLSTMTSTLSQSTVNRMNTKPYLFDGRSMKVSGKVTYTVEDGAETPRCFVYMPGIAACCAQGIEYVPPEGLAYPADYPADGDKLEVTGTFETYDADGVKLWRITDCTVEDLTAEA